MIKLLSTLLLTASTVFAQSNPDGRAWTPSLYGGGGWAPSRLVQEAIIKQPGFFDMTAHFYENSSSGFYGGMLLPLADWLSLDASYSTANESYNIDYAVLGNKRKESGTQNSSQFDLGLKIYSHGFSGGSIDWANGWGPDGRFWYPVLYLGFDQSDSRSKSELTFWNSGIIFRTDESNYRYRHAGLNLSLPMPEYITAALNYSRTFDRSYSDLDTPTRSFEDGGNASQWSLNLHKTANMSGGRADRAWNPDGRAGAVRVGASYGESYSGDMRTVRFVGLGLLAPAASWLSLRLGAAYAMNQAMPFQSGSAYAVETVRSSDGNISVSFSLRLFVPGTLTRPFDSSGFPADAEPETRAVKERDVEEDILNYEKDLIRKERIERARERAREGR